MCPITENVLSNLSSQPFEDRIVQHLPTRVLEALRPDASLCGVVRRSLRSVVRRWFDRRRDVVSR